MDIFFGFVELLYKSIFYFYFLKVVKSDMIRLLGNFSFGREY